MRPLDQIECIKCTYTVPGCGQAILLSNLLAIVSLTFVRSIFFLNRSPKTLDCAKVDPFKKNKRYRAVKDQIEALSPRVLPVNLSFRWLITCSASSFVRSIISRQVGISLILPTI